MYQRCASDVRALIALLLLRWGSSYRVHTHTPNASAAPVLTLAPRRINFAHLPH
jgi:hypothetical protein